MGGDQRVDHARHIAAGQIVGLQPPRRDARVRIGPDAGLHRHDLRVDDRPRVHLPQAHPDQAQQAHVGIRHKRLQPQLAVAEHHQRQHKRGHQRDATAAMNSSVLMSNDSFIAAHVSSQKPTRSWQLALGRPVGSMIPSASGPREADADATHRTTGRSAAIFRAKNASQAVGVAAVSRYRGTYADQALRPSLAAFAAGPSYHLKSPEENCHD